MGSGRDSVNCACTQIRAADKRARGLEVKRAWSTSCVSPWAIRAPPTSSWTGQPTPEPKRRRHFLRQTTGSLTISPASTEQRHRCENTGPTARAEPTRAHRATPALGPRADEPTARLRRAWIELLDGETPTLSSGAPGEPPPAMRPRPRAPRAYSRFPPCQSPPTRARLRSLHFHAPPTGRPWSLVARPTHQPRAALPSRGAGVKASRGAPGASALASSAHVRRPELDLALANLIQVVKSAPRPVTT